MHEKYDRDMIDLLRSIQNIDYIEPDEIPNIDLYMDQITTFMDDHLKSSKRFEDDEERKLLSNFAFICSLSFDIWVKKSVIESIIDKDMMDQKKSNSKKKN